MNLKNKIYWGFVGGLALVASFYFGKATFEKYNRLDVQPIQLEQREKADQKLVPKRNLDNILDAKTDDQTFSQDDEYFLLARLLVGECFNSSRETKEFVAHSVINRVGKSNWGNTLREVIFKPRQYSCLKDHNLDKMMDPLKDFFNPKLNKEYRGDVLMQWVDCYNAAFLSLVKHKYFDPTKGASSFHSGSPRTDWEEYFVFKKGDFYFYKLPR